MALGKRLPIASEAIKHIVTSPVKAARYFPNSPATTIAELTFVCSVAHGMPMFDPIASSTTRKPVPRWFYLAPSERAPTGSYGAAAPQSFMSCNVASRNGNAARPITRYSIGEGGRPWRGRPARQS